jgi:phosphoglycolate phosphatase-like HAD superfamily hydrolase
MKRLVVFDVDGTLTLTTESHDELFAQAVEEVLGIENVNTDWTTYRTVTDAGVTAELIERNGLRGTVQSVHDRVTALLRSDLVETPCREVPGAKKILSVLREHPDFECAIASGAWRESVLFKTRSAGLVIEHLPLATSDDSSQREEVVRMSIERAQSQYHLPSDTPVTLVGDGPWDFQVATNLQHQFVGIGSGRQRLLDCGAKHVLEDFTDVDRFLELVAQS